MRPVNLLPPELRPRTPGQGDQRIAWGILGVLAVILLVVIASISMSNRAKTLQDEATAMRAEAERKQAAVALIPVRGDDLSETVRQRTLLVGGLSNMRFPWNVALRDLSKTMPKDVTFNTITATSATAADTGGNVAPAGGVPQLQPQMTIAGCTSGWVGYARFLTWLRQMPGVSNVRSVSSALGAVVSESPDAEESEETDTIDDVERRENCQPQPLDFTLNVSYRPKTADLTGLPRPEATPTAGATGATTTPAAAGAATPGAGG